MPGGAIGLIYYLYIRWDVSSSIGLQEGDSAMANLKAANVQLAAFVISGRLSDPQFAAASTAEAIFGEGTRATFLAVDQSIFLPDMISLA